MNKSYIRTFVEEKELMDAMFTVERSNVTHFVEIEVLITFIEQIKDLSILNKIKHDLTLIDFRNGDAMHYLTYLAEAFVATNTEGV